MHELMNDLKGAWPRTMLLNTFLCSTDDKNCLSDIQHKLSIFPHFVSLNVEAI